MNNRKTPFTTPDESEKLANDVVDEISCRKFSDEYDECKKAKQMHKAHCKDSRRKMLECIFRTFR